MQIEILKVVHNVFSRQNKFMDPRVHCGRSDFEKVLKEFEFLFNPDPSTGKSILTYYVSEYLRTMKLKLYCLVTTFGHLFSLWTLLVIAIKLAKSQFYFQNAEIEFLFSNFIKEKIFWFHYEIENNVMCCCAMSFYLNYYTNLKITLVVIVMLTKQFLILFYFLSIWLV